MPEQLKSDWKKKKINQTIIKQNGNMAILMLKYLFPASATQTLMFLRREKISK